MTIQPEIFNEKLRPVLEAFEGKVSFCILPVGKEGPRLCLRETEAMTIASTGKLFILGTLLQKLTREGDTKEILLQRLQERIPYQKKDRVGGSGVIQFMSEGTLFTLYDLALLMIILSDNTATNMLIDVVGGTTKVLEHLDAHGFLNCGVNRKIAGKEVEPKVQERLMSLPGLSRRVQASFSRGSALEIASYLSKVETGDILLPAGREVFFDILEKQQYKDMFPRYLPVEDFFEEEGEYVKVFNKTGFDGPTRSDAGILQIREEKFAYCVIINEGKDTSYSPEQEGAVLMGKIGKAFYDSLTLV